MVTVKLRESRPEELPYFCDLEADADTWALPPPESQPQASRSTSIVQLCEPLDGADIDPDTPE